MGVNRRTALTLGAGVLAAVPGAARACSIAAPLPDLGAQRLSTIFELFRLWWARDEDAYYRMFTGPRLESPDGEDGFENWLQGDGRNVREFYENMFTRQNRFRELQAVTVVDAIAFVAVIEHSEGGIGPDCSGAPSTYQFTVEFRDAEPVGIAFVAKQTGFAFGQVTHWTSGR